MKKRGFLLVIGLFLALLSSGREVINLNRDWLFTLGNDLSLGRGTPVTLPHTWDQNSVSFRGEYERGIGNYIKKIDIPASWHGSRVYLRFNGVNSEATVQVNGRYVGSHHGGYTGFTFEITDCLTYGSSNNIWVVASNAPTLAQMPLSPDFVVYGGIYRDVELIVVPPAHVALNDYGSDGVYLIQRGVTRERAEVDCLVKVEGPLGSSYGVLVTVLTRDGEETLARASGRVKLNDTGNGQLTLPLAFNNPRLWNGRQDPYLYRVQIKLFGEATVLDSLEIPLGVRYFSVDPRSGFSLNGAPYRLNGVVRHEDFAGIGSALREIHHNEDLDLILEIGATAVRTGGTPQSPYFYGLCDTYGLVVWSDLPFVGSLGRRNPGFINSSEFRKNGKTQLVEMIRQHYNHPAILFWGIFSNLTVRGESPEAYIKELNQLSHREDPTRFTVATSNQDGPINFVTDLIGWSQYLGWTEGATTDVEVWLNQLQQEWGQLKSGIGEYGAEGSLLHQEDTLQRPENRDLWHPERWQTKFHTDYWRSIGRRPMLWGNFVASLSDWGNSYRRGGDTPGVQEEGLVTFDRKFKKDAFYFYKANWNKSDPFVYISERQWSKRATSRQNITVFSNQDEVELIVNGTSLGSKPGDLGSFVWSDVALQPGENFILVRAGRLRDSMTIFVGDIAW